MTATDNLCDVCKMNPMIGVASTSIPFSCAYCRECAERDADPEFVFEFWFDEFGTGDGKMTEGLADAAVTFKDGKYITYREWAEQRQEKDK